MADDVLLAISTFPDPETARRISEQLVNERLAACANILRAVQSIYRWEGKVENAAETMVFFKTTEERFTAFRTRLQTLHPYDVPEIVALRVSDGLPEYLRWVGESCS